MIECYFKECPNHEYNHHKDSEPFCNNDKCTATDTEIDEYEVLRREYLIANGINPKSEDEIY